MMVCVFLYGMTKVEKAIRATPYRRLPYALKLTVMLSWNLEKIETYPFHQ